MAYVKPRPSKYLIRVGRTKAGFGLFAVSDIPKNRFIIEYWGDVVTDEEADKIDGRYLFDLGNGKTIAGGTRKNIARYINHACRPNSESRKSGNRIYIFSIKRIKAGEEITYDYGKEYARVFIHPNCRCRTCEKRRELSSKR
jgi:hypothetical protein